MKHFFKLSFVLMSALVALLAGCVGEKAANTSSQPAVATVAPATPAAQPVADSAGSVGRIALKVVRVDSEETTADDNKGANAVDGNPETFWHTQWQDATPDLPHEIVVELVPPAVIKGFTYLPRQDDSENGTIQDYEFYVSADGKNFGQPVTKGAFENTKEKKTVTFAPVKCQFIKLRALSEANGGQWTSVAELAVIPAE